MLKNYCHFINTWIQVKRLTYRISNLGQYIVLTYNRLANTEVCIPTILSAYNHVTLFKRLIRTKFFTEASTVAINANKVLFTGTDLFYSQYLIISF